jgi:hypothetical protein
MKFLMAILLILFSGPSFSQEIIRWTSKEISKNEYEACENLQPYLIKDSSGHDTLSAEGFEVKILGTFKSTNLILLKSMDDKKFYILDSNKGQIDEIPGFPIFSSNPNRFACLGKPLSKTSQFAANSVFFKSCSNGIAILWQHWLLLRF